MDATARHAVGISNDVPWKSQKCIIPLAEDKTSESVGQTSGKGAATVGVDGEEGTDESEARRELCCSAVFPSHQSLTRSV